MARSMRGDRQAAHLVVVAVGVLLPARKPPALVLESCWPLLMGSMGMGPVRLAARLVAGAAALPPVSSSRLPSSFLGGCCAAAAGKLMLLVEVMVTSPGPKPPAWPACALTASACWNSASASAGVLGACTCA